MTTLLVAGGDVLRPDLSVEPADVVIDRESGTIEAVGEDLAGGDVLRPDLSVGPADVVIDRESGTIEAVGEDLAGDETLDAEGDLVMPGLVNAHTHVAMTLLRGFADDKPLGAWLEEDIWPVEAQLTPEDIRVGAELGLLEMIRSGTTTFSDMYFHVPEIAAAVEDAGLRAVLGHTAVTVGKDDEDARADVEESLEVARDLDGTAAGRITTTFQPHSLTTVDEDYLTEALPAAREAGLSAHFHANETAAEVEPIVEAHGVRPLVDARDRGLLEPGDILAHCVHVDETEIEVLADSGAGVAHCPASNMKLASGMAPVQRLLDAGIPVGIGTDGAASNNDLDMFDELRDAAMIGKLAAGDARAVDAGTAVSMATVGGADVLGLETGRIEASAVADLIVLDRDAPHLQPEHDPVSNLAYAARGSDVRHTVCDGQVLMRDRAVLTLDADRVMRRAEEHATELRTRVDS